MKTIIEILIVLFVLVVILGWFLKLVIPILIIVFAIMGTIYLLIKFLRQFLK